MKRNSAVRVPIAVLLGFAGILSLAGCLGHEKAYQVVDQSSAGTTSDTYGLPPGTAAPDASLLDTQGRPVTLSSVRANRPAALVFYRGGWCPPCNYQIHELQTHVKEFRKRGLSLIAISVDNPEHAVATAKEYGLDFAVLSDPRLTAHTAYRVIDHLGKMTAFMLARMGADLEERSGRDHHDVAVASVFLIDAGGVIRWAHADTDYGKRPSPSQILAAADRLGITVPTTAVAEPNP
jgi:peroxiredoxin